MKVLSFDIETIPQANLVTPEFDPASVKVGNIKDPALIAAKIDSARASAAQSYIDEAALYGETCQVACGSFCDGKLFNTFSAAAEGDTVAAIMSHITEAFYGQVPIVGYFIKSFDLPILMFRASVLNIALPKGLTTMVHGRLYWSDLVWDIADHPALAQVRSKKLAGLLASFGLPPKLADGAQFPELWKKDKPAALEYNRNDALVEWLLAKRLGMF